MRDLTELNKFQDYLIDHMYSCERKDKEDPEFNRYDRHLVICCDNAGKKLFDVICQYGSYGGDEGLLEIYCPAKWLYRFDDEDEYDADGYFTADDCIELIETHMTDEQRESITVSERGAFYEEIQ